MRVLYIHQFFTTPEGSSGTRSYEMAKALVRAGHQVTMVCATHAAGKSGLTGPFQRNRRSGLVDGIEVVEFGSGYSNSLGVGARMVAFLRYAFAAMRQASRRDYDLLFATSAPLTAALPGIWMKLGPVRKRPFVFEIRDPWPEVPRAMGMRNPVLLAGMELLETLAYRTADGHIALSPGMVKSFTRKGVPEHSVALIPNGSDTELFQPSTNKDLSAYGFAGDDAVFVYSGAHGQANGLDVLLDAAVILQERGATKVKLWLIGDGKRKPRLTDRARRADLKNVTFTDSLPKSKLAEVLPRAHAGLMILDDTPIFRWHSSPNKFFDYISCGLPVLVNHPGWIAELVAQNGCGTYAREAAALAASMEQWSVSRQRLATMGCASRELALKEFERGALASRLVQYLCTRTTQG